MASWLTMCWLIPNWAEFCSPVLFGLALRGLTGCLLAGHDSHLGLDVPPVVILGTPWWCFFGPGLG